MGIFSRRPRSVHDPRTPDGAFWDWWADEGHRIDPTTVGPHVDVLTRLIESVHPGLSWHFGPGRKARHRLTVSAGGLADARPAAERWFRAAPPSDATWEFAPAVEPDPDAFKAVLEIDGTPVDLGAVVFDIDVDQDRSRVDIGVQHPAFSTLDEQARAQVTFLVLDWALGEDGVARWVGSVTSLVEVPDEPRTLDDLSSAVATCAETRDPDAWTALSGEDSEGRPVVALARTGARWVDRPTLDLHHELVATFAAGDRGMPSPEDLGRLQALDESLMATIEPRGAVLAQVTSAGTRTLHVYTDGEDQNAAADVSSWAAAQGFTVAVAPDPGWARVRHLLG